MKVIIIYNPNSTGDSESNAKELARQLRKDKVTVETRPTKHAGHGEEIAARLARYLRLMLAVRLLLNQ